MTNLDRYDMLAHLDASGEGVANFAKAATSLARLYGCSKKQALNVLHEWNDGLKKEPRPNWSAMYIAENLRVFGREP